ncbi:MAG: hypothetical protein CMM07_23560 [Rhodopirellula sp.]|nr:hypothetical protein [Rhodopirellula sp.]
MVVFLSFFLYLLSQVTIVVSINRIYGLEVAGLYFFVLAAITPVSNFFQLGLRQYSLNKDSPILAKLLSVRIISSGALVFFAIPVYFVIVKGSDSDHATLGVKVFLMILSVKLFEGMVDIYLAAAKRQGDVLQFFSCFLFLFVSISIASWGQWLVQYESEVYFQILTAIYTFFSFWILFGLIKNFGHDRVFSKSSLVYCKETVPGLSKIGFGLLIMGLSASIPRILVERLGSISDVGIFSNILYGYILGLVFVNAFAAKVFTSKLGSSLTYPLLSLLILFFVGGVLINFQGESILFLVFGNEMSGKSEWLIFLYPSLCISLIVSFLDYRLIQLKAFSHFFAMNVLGLGSVMLASAVCFALQVDSLVAGGIALYSVAVIKLCCQVFLVNFIKTPR